MKRKGIILAGGAGTRLSPITKVISKQLLPVFDKPMIYFPLSTLMLGGIRDILIITTPQDGPIFKELLGDGHDLGIDIKYKSQSSPRGIAEALIIAEDFLGNHPSALILGDNIFYGNNLGKELHSASMQKHGATAFLYQTKNPKEYGVAEFDQEFTVLRIEEKPDEPKSDYAVTGLYFYDNLAPQMAKKLLPSRRGELEITDLNNAYANEGKLFCKVLGRGHAWFDAGTFDNLSEASQFIKIIESQQRQKVACLEEIAFLRGYISSQQLIELATNNINPDMATYLTKVCREGKRS